MSYTDKLIQILRKTVSEYQTTVTCIINSNKGVQYVSRTN